MKLPRADLVKMIHVPLLFTILCFFVFIFPACKRPSNQAMNQQSLDKDKIEFVTWYWLNSANTDEWEADFRKIKEIGFTSVALWYGWDTTLVASQPQSTIRALDLCRNVGLKVYLGIWSGTTMDPHHSAKLTAYKLIDNKGKKGEGLNIFDETWQKNWLQPYLAKIKNHYGTHSALAGYYMDDTLMYHIDEETLDDKLALDEGSAAVGYGKNVNGQFRQWLKEKYGSLDSLNKSWGTRCLSWTDVFAPKLAEDSQQAWLDWTEARKVWARSWGLLLHRTLDIDKGNRELIFSDFHTVLGAKLGAFGLTWDEITPYFTRIMIYNVNVSPEGMVTSRLSKLKSFTRGKVSISWGMFTFVIGEARNQKMLHPTKEQFLRQVREIRDQDVDIIDFYAYRVGDWTYPYEKLDNPLLGPENPAALLRYRVDLQMLLGQFQ